MRAMPKPMRWVMKFSAKFTPMKLWITAVLEDGTCIVENYDPTVIDKSKTFGDKKIGKFDLLPDESLLPYDRVIIDSFRVIDDNAENADKLYSEYVRMSYMPGLIDTEPATDDVNDRDDYYELHRKAVEKSDEYNVGDWLDLNYVGGREDGKIRFAPDTGSDEYDPEAGEKIVREAMKEFEGKPGIWVFVNSDIGNSGYSVRAKVYPDLETAVDDFMRRAPYVNSSNGTTGYEPDFPRSEYRAKITEGLTKENCYVEPCWGEFIMTVVKPGMTAVIFENDDDASSFYEFVL